MGIKSGYHDYFAQKNPAMILGACISISEKKKGKERKNETIK